MAIEIKKVSTKAELQQFIRYNYELYKNCQYSVPELYADAYRTLAREKNPAFEFCEADYFLAYKDNVLVGRVAAIINHRANFVLDGCKTKRCATACRNYKACSIIFIPTIANICSRILPVCRRGACHQARQ